MVEENEGMGAGLLAAGFALLITALNQAFTWERQKLQSEDDEEIKALLKSGPWRPSRASRVPSQRTATCGKLVRFRESELYLHHAKIVDDDRADGDMPVEYSSVIVSSRLLKKGFCWLDLGNRVSSSHVLVRPK